METHTLPHDHMQGIIPPHMIEVIKLRGDEKQREMAMNMEQLGETFRDERQAAAPPTAFMAAKIAEAAKLMPNRKVYDAEEKKILPGKLVRSEGDSPSGDTAVDEAYDGTGDTFNLYRDIYQRDSVDGNGKELVSSVHYGENIGNAFWNGDQMLFGDGDGTIFQSLTGSLSVIGHELSHGVVQFSGGLIYQDQSGALNESFADVFGALTVQYSRGQEAHEADWLIGDGIFAPGPPGSKRLALRSMKAPGTAYDDPILGKDPQPFHMDGYVFTYSDAGGVHINSGIPNHAFYLLAQYLGGEAWTKAGMIWYDAMQAINNPNATFQDWAEKTVEIARDNYKKDKEVVLFTRRAWKLVGISV